MNSQADGALRLDVVKISERSATIRQELLQLISQLGEDRLALSEMEADFHKQKAKRSCRAREAKSADISHYKNLREKLAQQREKTAQNREAVRQFVEQSRVSLFDARRAVEEAGILAAEAVYHLKELRRG